MKKVFILISAILLMAGLLLLFYEPFLKNILLFTGSLLHRELDFSFWKIGFERMGVEFLFLAVNILLAILFYKKYPKKFLLFSSVFWIGLFLVYVCMNVVNIPISDDYRYFLIFLNNYSSTYDLSAALKQETESRLLLMSLLSIFLFHLHAFSFKTLLFYSAACLLGISFFFYRSIRTEQKELLFLIIAILFFQFQYYNSVLLASDALYSTCTVFFVFYSLYLLTKSSSRLFILSLFCMLLAVLNNSSGFVGVLCGILLLIRERRIRELFIWLIFSILITVFYFTDYSFGDRLLFSDFTSFTDKIYQSLIFSFAFLGSSFQFLYQHTLPVIAGGLIWLCFLFLTLRKYYQKNSVIYFILLYFILTSFFLPFLRPGYEVKYAISIRYGVYAIAAVCCCVIAFFESINFKGRTQTAMLSFLLFSFLYHLSTNLFFYPEAVVRKEQLVTFIRHLKNNEPFQLPLYTPCTKEEAKAIIEESVSKNIYRIPDE